MLFNYLAFEVFTVFFSLIVLSTETFKFYSEDIYMYIILVLNFMIYSVIFSTHIFVGNFNFGSKPEFLFLDYGRNAPFGINLLFCKHFYFPFLESKSLDDLIDA